MYKYRIFYKHKKALSIAKSCHQEEFESSDFRSALLKAEVTAKSNNYRVVMVAEVTR